MSGGYTKPAAIVWTVTDATLIKANQEDISAWNNKEDAAFSTIMLCITPSLQQLISSKDNSKDAWDMLVTSLGAQGPALTYLDFKTMLQIKVSSGNLAMEIVKMAMIFNCLGTNHVQIPKIVRAMILLTASPCEYKSVSLVLLQTYNNTSLTFNIVKNALIADAQRCSMVLQQQQSPAALKISAVNCKGQNPDWIPQNGQMQSGGAGSGNKGKGKEQPSSGPICGKHAGYNKEKGDPKKKAHGHLASIVIGITDFLSQNLPVYSEHFPPSPSRSNLLKHLANVPLTKDPHKQNPLQCFISALPSNSSKLISLEYQQAHDAVKALDLAKSVHNIKPLEIAFTECALKKQKTGESSKIQDFELVSLGSESGTPPPGLVTIPETLENIMVGITLHKPYWPRWDEIDNCLRHDPDLDLSHIPYWEADSPPTSSDKGNNKKEALMVPPPKLPTIEQIAQRNLNEAHGFNQVEAELAARA